MDWTSWPTARFRSARFAAFIEATPVAHGEDFRVEFNAVRPHEALSLLRHQYPVAPPLRPLRTATITVGGHQITAEPEIPDEARELLNYLNPGGSVR